MTSLEQLKLSTKDFFDKHWDNNSGKKPLISRIHGSFSMNFRLLPIQDATPR